MSRSFIRTASGLNNQHHFHNADFIVFLEGGRESFTKAQVIAGSCHEETEDIIFWKHIFSNFKAGTRLKFKSVGSKATIMEIAVDIIDGILTTVYVAMDNEFDEILNQRLQHPNIFYTHGYSWENDVWNVDVITAILEELSAVSIENNDVSDNFTNFLSAIKAAVNADAYLFARGTSFFPRKTGILFCIECAPVDLPFVKRAVVNARFVEKGITRQTVNAFGRRKNIVTHKFCFGHLLADYCCQLIMHYLNKRHTLPSINKQYYYRMAIRKYFANHFNISDIFPYYEAQFSRV